MKVVFIIVLVSLAASLVVFGGLIYFYPVIEEEVGPTGDNDDRSETSTTYPWDRHRTKEPTTDENEIKECCDKFYIGVCKDFSKTHTLQMSTEVYFNQRSKILNTLNYSDNVITPKAVSTVRGFYSLCQEVDAAEDGLKKILDIFSQIGGFPALEGDTFDGSNWSWLETTRKLRGLGLFTDSLFTTKLGFNPLDLRNITLFITNPKLDMAQRDYCERGQECMTAFVIEFVKVLMKFGAVREVAAVDAIELYYLEKKLLNMVWNNPTVPKVYQTEDKARTLADLTSSFGFVQWREYFTILLGSQEYVKDDLVVVVENPGYLRSLKQVLEDTPNRLLANFMMWSVLLQLEEYVPSYRRSYFECYKFVEQTMSYALQWMYVSTTKSDDTKSKEVVLAMATHIKEELLRRVNASDWMSIETKQEAVRKVERIEIKVGYPQILLNSTFIDEYYGDISLYDSALESMLAIHKVYVDKHFNLCCRLVEEIFRDLSVNVFLPLVYYDGAQNSIHILQGALQDPIFSAERSMSGNFGVLGSIIAHEMSHAVDAVGYRYDVNGKRKSSSDCDQYLAAFEKKSQCFVDQYNSYMEFTEDVLLQNPRISGEYKKLENIADSVGVDLSLAAFKTYENALNQTGIKFTNRSSLSVERLFFVSFAQFYCVDYAASELVGVILDDHAPNPYRVVGPLLNSEDFGKLCDFESEGRTNRAKKCKML